MKSKFGKIAAAVVQAVLGVVLVVYPSTSLVIAVRVLGAVLLVSGVSAIVAYFFKEERFRLDSFQCLGGAVFIVLGLFVLANPKFVISIFPFLIGLAIAMHGIASATQTYNYRKLDLSGWKINLALSVITICIGIVIFANPFGTVLIALRLMGVVLIYSGVTGVWFAAIQ